MEPKELAERIVRILDLAADRFYVEELMDIPLPDVAYAREIKTLYGEYRRKTDFTTAARSSRVEVIEKIIRESETRS